MVWPDTATTFEVVIFDLGALALLGNLVCFGLAVYDVRRLYQERINGFARLAGWWGVESNTYVCTIQALALLVSWRALWTPAPLRPATTAFFSLGQFVFITVQGILLLLAVRQLVNRRRVIRYQVRVASLQDLAARRRARAGRET